MIEKVSISEAVYLVGEENWTDFLENLVRPDLDKLEIKNQKGRYFIMSTIVEFWEGTQWVVRYSIDQKELPLINVGVLDIATSDNSLELIDYQLDFFNKQKGNGEDVEWSKND